MSQSVLAIWLRKGWCLSQVTENILTVIFIESERAGWYSVDWLAEIWNITLMPLTAMFQLRSSFFEKNFSKLISANFLRH